MLLQGALLLALLFLFPAVARPQEVDDPPVAGESKEQAPRHEFVFSIGYAHPFERDAFKTTPDVGLPGGVALDLTYVYDLEPGLGLGVVIHGYSSTTDEITVVDASGNPIVADFTITPVSLALLGRLSAHRGPFHAFVFAAAGVCLGGINESALGELRLTGFSYSIGGGLRIPLDRQVALNVQAVASGANATWKQKPLADSESDRFNAGYVGVLIGIAVAVGDL